MEGRKQAGKPLIKSSRCDSQRLRRSLVIPHHYFSAPPEFDGSARWFFLSTFPKLPGRLEGKTNRLPNENLMDFRQLGPSVCPFSWPGKLTYRVTLGGALSVDPHTRWLFALKHEKEKSLINKQHSLAAVRRCRPHRQSEWKPDTRHLIHKKNKLPPFPEINKSFSHVWNFISI